MVGSSARTNRSNLFYLVYGQFRRVGEFEPLRLEPIEKGTSAGEGAARVIAAERSKP
jgi:hypothetical protein